MPIELSKQKLIEVLGLASGVSSNERLVFNSIATKLGEIRGGELWACVDSSIKDLEQAFKRGATLALTENTDLLQSFEEPERLISVPSIESALRQIALWWYSNCNAKAIFICANSERIALKELLARILLKKSRGAYNFSSDTDYLSMLKIICSLHKDSEWLILDSESPMSSKTVQLIQALQPCALLIDNINAEDNEMVKNILSRSVNSNCVVANKDLINKDFLNRYKLCQSAQANLAEQKESSEMQVLNLKLLGVNGVSFELKNQSEILKFETSVLGPRVGELLAMASVTAQQIYTNLPLSEISKTISGIPSGIIPPTLYPLTDNRVLLADVEQANRIDLDKTKETILAGKTDYRNFAVIFGEIWQYGSNMEIQTLEDHLYYIAELCKLKPEFIVCYGKYASDCTMKIKELGIKAFLASSVDEAGHIAMKLPFNMLVVKSAKATGLHKTVQLITEKHGVTPRPPEPSFKNA